MVNKESDGWFNGKGVLDGNVIDKRIHQRSMLNTRDGIGMRNGMIRCIKEYITEIHLLFFDSLRFTIAATHPAQFTF